MSHIFREGGYAHAVLSRHLHSWCLQRSTQTSGEEHCCFLQASEEQPLETPCEVTTCSLSEGCSWPRGTACPLNLKSLIHPGWENADRSLKQATKHTAPYLTLNLKVRCANPHFIFMERPTLPLAAEVSCSAVSPCTPS